MNTAESIQDILDEIEFTGYHFRSSGEAGRLYIQASFMAPDCQGGGQTQQFTRKWYISQEATKSEIVQAAFKLVITSLEHEAREFFKYKGQPIFGPHFNVDFLAGALQTARDLIIEERSALPVDNTSK